MTDQDVDREERIGRELRAIRADCLQMAVDSCRDGGDILKTASLYSDFVIMGRQAESARVISFRQVN